MFPMIFGFLAAMALSISLISQRFERVMLGHLFSHAGKPILRASRRTFSLGKKAKGLMMHKTPPKRGK